MEHRKEINWTKPTRSWFFSAPTLGSVRIDKDGVDHYFALVYNFRGEAVVIQSHGEYAKLIAKRMRYFLHFI